MARQPSRRPCLFKVSSLLYTLHLKGYRVSLDKDGNKRKMVSAGFRTKRPAARL